jgi:hypothetical protein
MSIAIGLYFPMTLYPLITMQPPARGAAPVLSTTAASMGGLERGVADYLPPASTFMGPIQAADEPDRGDTVLPTVERVIWKGRHYQLLLSGLFNDPVAYRLALMVRLALRSIVPKL